MMKPDILSMTQDELAEFVISLGEAKFRAAQLYSWMQKGAAFDEMTNLSKSFRKKLAENSEYRLPSVERNLNQNLTKR